PHLSCLNAPIDLFLPLTALCHLKCTSAHVFWRVFTQVTHIKLSWFPKNNNACLSVTSSCAFSSSPLLFSTHSSLSLSFPPSRFKLVVTSLNTFGLFNSWFSAST
ncbi:unnamed protein product, partial [Hymenolepis diminuta]